MTDSQKPAATLRQWIDGENRPAVPIEVASIIREAADALERGAPPAVCSGTGTTPANVATLYTSQEGLCGICQRSVPVVSTNTGSYCATHPYPAAVHHIAGCGNTEGDWNFEEVTCPKCLRAMLNFEWVQGMRNALAHDALLPINAVHINGICCNTGGAWTNAADVTCARCLRAMVHTLDGFATDTQVERDAEKARADKLAEACAIFEKGSAENTEVYELLRAAGLPTASHASTVASLLAERDAAVKRAEEAERDLADSRAKRQRTPVTGETLVEQKPDEPQFVTVALDAVKRVIEERAAPVPMILHCPECRARHVDKGDFATRAHHTHPCQNC